MEIVDIDGTCAVATRQTILAASRISYYNRRSRPAVHWFSDSGNIPKRASVH
jgi:hypothetical protein